MALSQQGRPQNRWHRTFNDALSEIQAAASWIDSIAAELALPDEQAFAIQVCLEELMLNILQHGRESSSERSARSPRRGFAHPLNISITVEAFPDRVTMILEDNGCPFNVARAPAKPIDQPLDKVQPGGLGIHLIKIFATKLEYSRTEAGNRVIVEFLG